MPVGAPPGTGPRQVHQSGSDRRREAVSDQYLGDIGDERHREALL